MLSVVMGLQKECLQSRKLEGKGKSIERRTESSRVLPDQTDYTQQFIHSLFSSFISSFIIDLLDFRNFLVYIYLIYDAFFSQKPQLSLGRRQVNRALKKNLLLRGWWEMSEKHHSGRRCQARHEENIKFLKGDES